VCCIDAFNDQTWNCPGLHPAERVRRHDVYDRYLCEEMFPMVAARAGRGDTAVYGASLGGFHAANFAARHPEQVARCIALSGLFDSRRLLEGYWDDLCYYHSPVHFVPNMDHDWARRLGRVEWVIATGEQDSLVGETRNFSQILRDKGIPVHSEIWPGVFGHDWPFWKQHLPRFLP
jgi:esterase/lipase superfamily enzyme